MTLHNQKTDGSGICHAIVIEKCRRDEFLLKDSYEADAPILIPLERKTYYQNYVSRVRPNNVGITDVMDLFKKHAAEPIKWGVARNDRIISDEGYALEFRLRK